MSDATKKRSRRFLFHTMDWPQYRSLYLLALLSACVVSLFTFSDALERGELWTHDLRFQLRGERERPSGTKIVIVAVSQDTLDTWEREPMVFWGGHYAKAIDTLLKQHVQLIGFDMILNFSADDYLENIGVTDHLPDLALLQAFKKSGDEGVPVVFPYLFAASEKKVDFNEKVGFNKRFQYVTETNSGCINTITAADGVMRQVYLFVEDAKGSQPGFAALMAARLRHLDPTRPTDLKRLAPRAAPLSRREPEQKTFWINCVNRAQDATHTFHTLSLEKLTQASLPEDEAELLKDAIVLIGPTYPGANDLQREPDGRAHSGIEVHADALATLLDGCALGRWPRSVEFLLTLVWGLLSCLAAFCLTKRGGALILAANGIWLLGAYWAFSHHNWLVPVAGPLLGMLLPGGGFYALSASRARRQVQETRLRMVPFVSAPVFAKILDASHRPQPGLPDPDHSGLHDLSVLFLDIRGFTLQSEKQADEDMVTRLNKLLGELYPILAAHGGLLNCYTGDGFLALFGTDSAPSPEKGRAFHACEAVLAAIEMLKKVEKMNRESSDLRAKTGESGWKIGCGIHSGTACCGYVGVAERMGYTAVGNTVNVGARLESMNKILESVLVISDTTYQRLRPPPLRFHTGKYPLDARYPEEEVRVHYLKQEDIAALLSENR